MTNSVANIATNPYKQDFPLLVANPDLAFLDSAATAQRPQCVIDAQCKFYQTTNANPLRGLYSLSVEATQAIDEARASIAQFIGVEDTKEIIFTKNASESLNLVAQAFGSVVVSAGDEIVVSIMEHHSNLIPWQRLAQRTQAKIKFIYCDKQGKLDLDQVKQIITPRTKIVAIGHVSNVLGCKNPVSEIAKLAHAQGAYVVVDACQSLPHLPLDVTSLGCDFLACSAHKAYGPFGIGILWGKRELLEAADAFLTGGEMISSVSQTQASWAPIPEKFEAGTQDAAGIWASKCALDYMRQIGLDTIQARDEALVAYAFERLRQLDFIEIIGSVEPQDHHGLISFNVKGIHPHDVSSILDMHHVAIRAGHHCAEPLLDFLGIDSCCRASFAFYNDQSDIDQLVDGLCSVWRMFNGG